MDVANTQYYYVHMGDSNSNALREMWQIRNPALWLKYHRSQVHKRITEARPRQGALERRCRGRHCAHQKRLQPLVQRTPRYSNSPARSLHMVHVRAHPPSRPELSQATFNTCSTRLGTNSLTHSQEYIHIPTPPVSGSNRLQRWRLFLTVLELLCEKHI